MVLDRSRREHLVASYPRMHPKSRIVSGICHERERTSLLSEWILVPWFSDTDNLGGWVVECKKQRQIAHTPREPTPYLDRFTLLLPRWLLPMYQRRHRCRLITTTC